MPVTRSRAATRGIRTCSTSCGAGVPLCRRPAAPARRLFTLGFLRDGVFLWVRSRARPCTGSVGRDPLNRAVQSVGHRFVPHLRSLLVTDLFAIDPVGFTGQRALPWEPDARRVLDYLSATVSAYGGVQRLPPGVFAEASAAPVCLLVLSTVPAKPRDVK
jgi:hypothetical protein